MHNNSLIEEHEVIYFMIFFQGFFFNESCKPTGLDWKLQA
jgi:hypothetical protein